MEFAICDENVKECPDGSNVSRDENNNCKFKDFPRTSSQSTHKGNDNDNNDSKVGKGARGKKKGHNDGRKKGKNKKKKGYEDDDDDDDLASTEVPSANNDDNDSNYMKKKGKKNNEGYKLENSYRNCVIIRLDATMYSRLKSVLESVTKATCESML